MNTNILRVGALLGVVTALSCCRFSSQGRSPRSVQRSTPPSVVSQAPTWNMNDLEFFYHGTMSTEVLPEAVWDAFVGAYPDLFPAGGFLAFGLIPDRESPLPIGVSRRPVPHLGNLPSLGVNCAACHVADVLTPGNPKPIRVLGATSHFDAEAYFGAITAAGFRTADPKNMKRFLANYLAARDPWGARKEGQELFELAWRRQEKAIAAKLAADPFGDKGAGPDGFHVLQPSELRVTREMLRRNMDLAATAHAMLKLFHNMRAALHLPHRPPKTLPPASGPGRNDAFGLLSAALFHQPRPYAPVKYGVAWDLGPRPWVHWDGNNRSPIGRNVLASLGLGSPLRGKRAEFDFAAIQRQTDLVERIRAPRYPFAVDQAAASRGAQIYAKHCAACHDGPETDRRLHSPWEVRTDPTRAEAFTAAQAKRFNRLLTEVTAPGYAPPKEPGLRATGKYWAPSLAGVWARSPYLHNGSVRTMRELLSPVRARAVKFRRGTRVYDAANLGYADAGPYLLDTTKPGNARTGHSYGVSLTPQQKTDLIEFLKTK